MSSYVNDTFNILFGKRKAAPNGHSLAPPHKRTAVKAHPQDVPEPEAPGYLAKLRTEVPAHFKEASNVLSAIRRPYPTGSGDGTYPDEHKEDGGWLDVFGSLNIENWESLIATAQKQLTGDDWDDREYLMERIIQTAAKLRVGSDASNNVSGLFVKRLWDDLKHPPQSFLGKQFQYRSADGSGNNIMFPHIGAADTPYARTVKPLRQHKGALPDPGLIFDSVMSRAYEEEHPNKISSQLFYLASIIIHDAFRTDHRDPNISRTSSYLDLSPLYGSNAEEQKLMRTYESGKIKPDCFSEKRILGFPPGVGTLLIMFNRFHNMVVENLAKINEGGRFDKPESQQAHSSPWRGRKDKTWEQYDEDLFQTGRLITCGLYVNIILVDYVRTILNLNRTNSDWSLDPRMDFGDLPSGLGNQVSAEFNLVYRWHSTLSARDTKWVEALYKKMFKRSDYSNITMEEFLMCLARYEASIPDAPEQRDFDGLKRDVDGKFSDDELVEILVSGIEDCSNSFGPRRVPEVLRAVQILGIRQARAWDLSTLNEFRSHFKLKPYSSFEEITSDVHTQEQLKHLYDTPDNIELYTGLVCEDAKKAVMPGSGLMPPYTISRAVLSDAVALVRGDRFYTTEFHPKALTNWGYSEVASNKTVDHGAVFYKLIYNAFPNHFDYKSVYAHYPLTVPREMMKILTGLEKADQYDDKRPARKPRQEIVSSYKTVTSILDDKKLYGVSWGNAMTFLMGYEAKDFMLAGDGPKNLQSRAMMRDALYTDGWHQDVRSWYSTKTRELLAEKSYKIGRGVNQADMIRDVCNIVHVHFVSEMFTLPLKTRTYPHGIFTEHELYLILSAVFICVFFDIDASQSFLIHHVSREATQKLGQLVELNVQAISKTGVLADLFQSSVDRNKPSVLPDYGVHMIKRLLASGMNVHQLVWGHILGTAGGMVPNQGQLFGEVLDFFFADPIGQNVWPEVVRIAKSDESDADAKLLRYLLEASRLHCVSAVFRDVQSDVTIQDGSRTLNLKTGEKVFANLYAACRDPTAFPDPLEVKLDRPIESYVQLGWGPHQCLGMSMTQVANTAVLRELARLPNLRPAPGPQGKIAKVPSPIPGYMQYLTDEWNGYFPFPCNMKMQWD